jgi:hypothetical protein
MSFCCQLLIILPPQCLLFSCWPGWSCRHLHIILMSAERCWSHAMQLKKESEGEGQSTTAPRKRHHALRRLRKAAVWAAELSRFAAACCDTRSALEAEAYSSWMAGNVLMERETDWEKALATYSRARWGGGREGGRQLGLRAGMMFRALFYLPAVAVCLRLTCCRYQNIKTVSLSLSTPPGGGGRDDYSSAGRQLRLAERTSVVVTHHTALSS